jgi:diguanylate cyclase (GGDEF)-like protein/PAS domain S-box-containing protein
MGFLETLTIATGLGAFGFLLYVGWRHWAARAAGGRATLRAAAPADTAPGPRSPASASARDGVESGAGIGAALLDSMSDPAILHDDRIRYANPAAGRFFGMAPEALVGRPVEVVAHPEFREAVMDYVVARISGAAVAVSGILLDLAEGPRGCILVPVGEPQADGSACTLIRPAVHPDPARVVDSSLALETLESITEGILTTDSEGRIGYMNAAAEHLTGAHRENARGRTLPDLVTLVDEQDERSLGDPVAQCLEEDRRIDLGRRAILVSRTTGEECSIEVRVSPIRQGGREMSGCVVVLHDVSEIRGLARQMSYQASHDPLTGLVNRREFERRVSEAIGTVRTGSGNHVLCYLDLDRFKRVNDTCGHVAGDDLLREIAGVIRSEVRDSDTVARIGGDEFGMLLSGCPLDKARQIADDVCAAIRDYRYVWRDQIFTVGVSIGLVEIGHESGSMEDLLSAADSACYVAKQQGRGRVHVYSARDEAVARQRGEILWLQRLQAALKEDQFELYVQPIVSVGGRVETGPACEVLLRLRDAEEGTISPASFMQAAERYHLMPNVDRWVLQTAFAAIGSGSLKLPDQRSCAINLSGQTLGDPQFLDFVVDCLDHTGVPPARVCFEITESAVMSNLTHAARFIAVLHGMGCQFALDDFGGGMGSFAQLKNLSLDYLKIDGSFVRDLGTDEVSQAMLNAMVDLARTLDIQVIAEQVEDEAAYGRLRSLGVDFVQGYVVGRPKPLAAPLEDAPSR